MTGLHVVRKSGKAGNTWYVYAWRGGPCIHKAVGARPVIGPELLARAMGERSARSGGDPALFDSLINDYRASPEFTALAPATQRDYRLWLDRMSERFGKAALAAFEDQRMRRVIIEWRNQWAAQPRTADKASVMMGTVLGWAVEQGVLSVNVAARIRQLHHVNKADQVWEDRHWQALQALDDEGKPICPPHLMDALRLALLTGLRLSDLVALDWSEVGEKAIITTTRKRGGRAVIPILPELRAHLDARDHRTGPVLRTTRGTGWTASGLGTIFQRVKPKGFDRTIHDLRGTYATWLAQKGLTDEQIARIIGWTARRVSQIRARYVDEARVVISLIERLSA